MTYLWMCRVYGLLNQPNSLLLLRSRSLLKKELWLDIFGRKTHRRHQIHSFLLFICRNIYNILISIRISSRSDEKFRHGWVCFDILRAIHNMMLGHHCVLLHGSPRLCRQLLRSRIYYLWLEDWARTRRLPHLMLWQLLLIVMLLSRDYCILIWGHHSSWLGLSMATCRSFRMGSGWDTLAIRWIFCRVCFAILVTMQRRGLQSRRLFAIGSFLEGVLSWVLIFYDW